jgi:hypothetical protein
MAGMEDTSRNLSTVQTGVITLVSHATCISVQTKTDQTYS